MHDAIACELRPLQPGELSQLLRGVDYGRIPGKPPEEVDAWVEWAAGNNTITWPTLGITLSSLSGTPAGDWTSAAVVSKGEYGVPPGLVFGYPCTSDGKGNWSVVSGLTLDEYGKGMFQKTLTELLEEQDAVKDLLPG